jgi:hypothetical protein
MNTHRIEYLQLIINDLLLIKDNINSLWATNLITTTTSVMLEDFIDTKLKKYNEKLEKLL